VLVEVEDDTVLVPSGAVELETVVVDWPVTTPLVWVVVVVVVVVDWPVSAQAASEAATAQATAARERIRERMLGLLVRGCACGVWRGRP
jgi:threonine/homoserine/homoserine lactone efflux protein